MKEIELTKGLKAKVDDEDYEYLNQWKWHVSCIGNYYYAKRYQYGDGKPKYLAMSRLIAKTHPGMECDHINHDTLDNRKINLRNCTHINNGRNGSPTGISKYLGVSKHSNSKKWQARIRHDGKDRYLGLYYNQWAAAIAYDIAAKKYYKEFANSNFK